MTTYTFGELLKKYRNWADLSQADLAARIGRGRNTISNWERGKNLPDRETVLLIGEKLGLHTAQTNEWLESAGYSPIPLMGELTDPALPQLDLPYDSWALARESPVPSGRG